MKSSSQFSHFKWWGKEDNFCECSLADPHVNHEDTALFVLSPSVGGKRLQEGKRVFHARIKIRKSELDVIYHVNLHSI